MQLRPTICKFVHRLILIILTFQAVIMKQILTILALTAITLASEAQGVQATGKPVGEVLILKEPSYDFGKIPQGKPVTHEFELVNTSADTLKIENVQASCGCTTPVWKKDPVAPGGSTKINVGYNALAEGNFERLVTVYYNGNQVKTLTIKGNVYKVPATSAPQNSSVEILKQINQ